MMVAAIFIVSNPMSSPKIRKDGRQFDQLRSLSFQPDFAGFAASSVLTCCGQTRVLMTVSIEDTVPKFLAGSGQGWLTAEYRMLPGATPERQTREFMKLSGRTQEIQRLIGRSLRASLDMSLLGEKTITIDADVLQADAGTRTTAITGGYVALALAIDKLLQTGRLTQNPLIHQVAAVSVGLLDGVAVLDMDYSEDVAASVDFNVVMNNQGQLIEVQGTAEEGSFSRGELNQLLDLAEKGISEFFTLQQAALMGFNSSHPKV
jgi:ribonuclease PH